MSQNCAHHGDCLTCLAENAPQNCPLIMEIPESWRTTLIANLEVFGSTKGQQMAQTLRHHWGLSDSLLCWSHHGVPFHRPTRLTPLP